MNVDIVFSYGIGIFYILIFIFSKLYRSFFSERIITISIKVISILIGIVSYRLAFENNFLHYIYITKELSIFLCQFYIVLSIYFSVKEY